MDPSAIARQFLEDGFALARNVFSASEIAEIEAQLNEFIDTTMGRMEPGNIYFEDTPEKPIKAIHNIEQYSPYFERLARDRRLLNIVQAIWPDVDIIPHGMMFFGKAAHSGSVAPPHQDNAFQNLNPPEDLVCTIAIDQSTSANGALCVQRASHTLGSLPHRPSGVMGFSQTLLEPVDKHQYPEIQLCMEPGDVCLHHTNTIHYSGPNSTGKSRRQLGIGYRTVRAKRDERAWANYQAELQKLHASEVAATQK